MSPGSSGGPVLDPTGVVVGIVRASITAGQNLNFAVPGDVAERFIQHNDGTTAAKVPEDQTLSKLMKYVQLAMFTDAVKLLDDAISRDEFNPYLRAWSGYCYWRNGQPEQALQPLLIAWRVLPQSWKINEILARVYSDLWEGVLKETLGHYGESTFDLFARYRRLRDKTEYRRWVYRFCEGVIKSGDEYVQQPAEWPLPSVSGDRKTATNEATEVMTKLMAVNGTFMSNFPSLVDFRPLGGSKVKIMTVPVQGFGLSGEGTVTDDQTTLSGSATQVDYSGCRLRYDVRAHTFDKGMAVDFIPVLKSVEGGCYLQSACSTKDQCVSWNKNRIGQSVGSFRGERVR